MNPQLHPAEGSEPFAPLIPILRALESDGNVAVDGGFLNSPAGWYCRVREPIDFTLLRSHLEIPVHIELMDDRDVVFDRSTWCAIIGPGAEGY